MKAEKQHITGIILAGGKSTRMGEDKGLIVYNKQPFIQHVINALEPIVSEIIIVSNNPEHDVFAEKRVEDLIPNSGPIAGLYTGLYYSKTEENLVLSCDIPLISTSVLNALINASDKTINCVQIESNNKIMPLIALYKKQCKDTCFTLLEQGERRLKVLTRQLKTKTIVLDKALAIHTTNVNTPIELKEINHATNS
ncbi:molybdenum cofactor guanylyltransferase [Pontimicrobium sp. MEBiC06410]